MRNLDRHLEALTNGPPVGPLEQVAAAIRRAFIDYQDAAETRRTLGFEIDDVNARLLAAMTAAGFSEAEARAADVHMLADGRWSPSGRSAMCGAR